MTTSIGKIDSRPPSPGTKCILVSPEVGERIRNVELITIVAETNDPGIYIVRNGDGQIFRASRLHMKDQSSLEPL